MSKYSCSLLKRVNDIESMNRLIQFLVGLCDDYEGARSHILTMDPLPSINKAYYIASQVDSGNAASRSI